MIYLFSSARRELYIQDVLDVLALPYETIYCFQYEDKLIDAPLCQDFQSYNNHTDEDVLIFYVDEPCEDVTQALTNPVIHFYPLRRAKIKTVVRDGSVYYIYFVLGAYVDWQQYEITSIDEKIVQALPGNNPQLTQYVLSLPTDVLMPYVVFAEQDQAPVVWQSIVTQINKDVLAFKNTVFYRINGMSQIQSTNKVLHDLHSVFNLTRSMRNITKRNVTQAQRKDIPVKELLPNSTGYELESGKMYILDVRFFHGEEVDEPVLGSKILPTVNDAYFAFQPDEIDVTFRYNRREIALVTKVTNRDSYTLMKLSLQEGETAPKDEDTQKEETVQKQSPCDPLLRAPQINLLLKLTYPRMKYWIAFFLLFIGQILIAFPSVYGSLSSGEPISIKVLIGALWFVGSAIYVVVLFVLFGSLPGAPSSSP